MCSAREETEIVLHYLTEYLSAQGADSNTEVCTDFLLTDLRVGFPLFSLLFANYTHCEAAVNDAVENLLHQSAGQLISSPLELSMKIDTPNYVRRSCLEIFERIPFERLHEILSAEESDECVCVLADSLTRVGKDIRSASGLSRAFSAALNEAWSETEFKKVLVENIAAALDSDCHTPEEHEGLPIVRLAVGGLFQNRKIHLAIAALNSESNFSQQLRSVSNCLENSGKLDLLVVVPVGSTIGIERELRAAFPLEDYLLLDSCGLMEFATSAEPREVLKRLLLEVVPLTVVSPYKSHGPVDGEVFVGRVKEIRRIVEMKSTNFTVVGSRQIGKSSLMKAVQRALADSNDVEAIYIDVGTCRRLDQMYFWLADELLNVDGAAGFDAYDSARAGQEAFLQGLASHLRRSEKKLILLLDEIDSVLHDPAAEQFGSFVRSLANEDKVRFVFSGYTRLKSKTDDQQSFLFNLCDQISLGPLNNKEAMQLVQGPMERLGVTFESSSTLDQILEHGSTIAWVLQYFCELLLRHLEDQNRRVIFNDDVRHVADGNEFARKLCRIVDAPERPLLEKILIYICASKPDDLVDESEIVQGIQTRLYEISFVEIRDTLNYLVDTYIFSRDHCKYRFFNPQLKNAIRVRDDDCERVLAALVRDFRQTDSTAAV